MKAKTIISMQILNSKIKPPEHTNEHPLDEPSSSVEAQNVELRAPQVSTIQH